MKNILQKIFYAKSNRTKVAFLRKTIVICKMNFLCIGEQRQPTCELILFIKCINFLLVSLSFFISLKIFFPLLISLYFSSHMTVGEMIV
jgi:hypothetical protein